MPNDAMVEYFIEGYLRYLNQFLEFTLKHKWAGFMTLSCALLIAKLQEYKLERMRKSGEKI